MLHVSCATAFRFDSHLGDFPFDLFTFFKTFQSARFAVRFKVRFGLQLGLRLGLEFILYVYFVSARPVAAAILAAKTQNLKYFFQCRLQVLQSLLRV